MSVEDRIATIERLRYCRNCFAFNHIASACKSNRNCRECNSRHNTLIHSNSNANTRANRRSSPYPNRQNVSTNASQNIRQNPSVNFDQLTHPIQTSPFPSAMYRISIPAHPSPIQSNLPTGKCLVVPILIELYR